MNISMYRTAKSLELVEVEVYGCFIYYSYLFLHKTLILRNVVFKLNKKNSHFFVLIPTYSPYKNRIKFNKYFIFTIFIN